MKSRADPDFRKAYRKLPTEVRDRARKAYRLFIQNPHHPSLHFKRIHSVDPVYSVRVGLGYRALGLRIGEVITWFWIGTHAEYDKKVSRR